MSSNTPLEEGLSFTPRYDQNGLIPCIVVGAASGKVLMLAYMNDQALAKTLETGEMHYWSRSRGELWHKGATSGQVQKLISMTTDCDQDALLCAVEMPLEKGREKSCHTGRQSCFYREVLQDETARLRFTDTDL